MYGSLMFLRLPQGTHKLLRDDLELQGLPPPMNDKPR